MWYTEIEKNIKKALRHLPNLDSSTEMLEFVIKKHKGKDFYEVSIIMNLPIKNLYAHFEGYNPQECMYECFDRIIEEAKKYKEKHLVSDSNYPHHETFRKD